ncbi:MAG: hypothetical protein AAFR47_23330, partial [Pseudomonadota bacterium]
MTFCHWSGSASAEPTQYEFTGFDLASLQEEGVSGQLSRGDTFTMPGSATVNFEVTDNDDSLSGDRFFR